MGKKEKGRGLELGGVFFDLKKSSLFVQSSFHQVPLIIIFPLLL